MSDEHTPAWVLRMEKATDSGAVAGERTGYRCSAFEANRVAREWREMRAEIERLKQWVSDCQSGMYINCVYCGHRYGPQDEVPSTMADVLKEHCEQCPKHPLSHAKQEIERLRAELANRTQAARWLHDNAEDVAAGRETTTQHWLWLKEVADE